MSSKVLAGRYELLEKIGDGGMAVVYRAMDKLLNRLVAIKILKPQFTEDEKFIDNFRKESHAAASLSHPNIVGIYDVGREGNINYIVMELVRGRALSEIIHDEGPLDYQQTVDYARQIASGLSAAHKQGIIHRDIKPHNILVNTDGIAKIADFGIAKAVSVSTIVDYTTENNIIGSVHYFSPEQARGGYVDARSDIYSLGIVMYEMITGQVPFDGDNPVSVALMQINDPITPPSQYVSMPPALEKIILKATDKMAINRYQSAEEVIQALDEMDLVNRIVGGETIVRGTHSGDAKREEAEELRRIAAEEDDRDRRDAGKSKNKKKKPQRHINKRKLSIAIAIAAAVVLIGLGIAVATGAFSNKMVEVPELRGMTYDQAKDRLEEAGLVIKESDMIFSSEYASGEVAAQDPEKGTEVKEGSAVTVSLSKGAEEGTVPTLTNMDVEEAKDLLQKYGFKVGQTYTETSPQPAGRVIDQSPEEGTVMEVGSTIDLTVSDGKGKLQQEVPSLVGMSKAEAEAELHNRNLELGEINYEVSTKFSKDVIMEQTIEAGTKVDEGTSVGITISKGASSTINYDVDYTLSEEEVFYMTITVTDDNGTRNVISNQQCQRADGDETFAITGTGEGTIVVTFDDKTVVTQSVDFTTGELR